MERLTKIKLCFGELSFLNEGEVRLLPAAPALNQQKLDTVQLLRLLKYESPIDKLQVFRAWLSSFGELTLDEGMYYTKIQLQAFNQTILQEFKKDDWQTFLFDKDGFSYLFRMFEVALFRAKSNQFYAST